MTTINPTPTYSENFDTPLDAGRWRTYSGPGPNNEGTWQPGNVQVAHSCLYLVGTGTNCAGASMIGGQIYGRWEMRARLDPGKGFGLGIGLQPDSNDIGEGRIDLWDINNGLSNGASQLIVRPGNTQDYSKQKWTSLVGSDWHIYAVEWLPERITFFIDGTNVYEITDRSYIPTTSRHFYAQLTSGVPGGTQGISVRDVATPNPLNMQIDYLKIYTVASATPPTPVPPPPTPPSPPAAGQKGNWTQTYFNDFTGSLDWTQFGNYGPGPGTSGEGYMVEGNVSNAGGSLQLRGTPSGGSGLAMHVGQLHGRWEMRMKRPVGPGFGPAIGLWPDSDDWNDGEIDIFECTSGAADSASFTNHKPGNPTDNSKQDSETLNVALWHKYALEWTADRITWYIDDVQKYEITDKAYIPTAAMHFFAQLDQGIPGGTLGIPVADGSTPNPYVFEIDYLKISIPTVGGPTPIPIPAGGWTLVDSDDFSIGSTPSSARWTDTDGSTGAAGPITGEWDMWVDPTSLAAAHVGDYSDPVQQAGVQHVADTPMSTWVAGNWSGGTIDSGNHTLADAITAANSAGKRATFSVYWAPVRDNGGASAGGANDWTVYQNWITTVVSPAIGSAYAAAIIEADAIPLSVGLLPSDQAARLAGLSAAVQYLKSHNPNLKVYLDVGHSAWLSASALAPLMVSAGIAYADGFSGNVSGYRPNPEIATWSAEIQSELATRGITGKTWIIDTGRNGANPPLDPQDWENAVGAVLGLQPLYAPGQNVGGYAGCDGFLWVKRPGESDGNGPNSVTSNGHNAPPAGQWFGSWLIDVLSRSNITGTPLVTANQELQMRASANVAHGMKHNLSQSYGRYAFRTSIPRGAGYGVLATLKSASSADGEIRIVDTTDGLANKTIFYVRKPGTSSTLTQPVSIDLTPYQTWSIEWMPQSVKFYVGTALVWSVTDPTYIPSAALHFEISEIVGTGSNGIPVLAASTPQPFVVHFDDYKMYAPGSAGGTDPTPAQTDLELKNRSVHEGLKHRYLRFDGAIMQRESDNKVVSEGQPYMMLASVMIGDKATFDLVESFNQNVLERKNWKPGGVDNWRLNTGDDPRTKAPNCMAWDYRVNPYGSNPANTVFDWNFATDADWDRVKALIHAYFRWKDVKYLNKALAIVRDLLNFATNTVGTTSYQASDEWQRIVNPDRTFTQGNHQSGGNGIMETNPSYFDLSAYELALTAGNDSRIAQLRTGALEMLTESTDNTAPLATTHGLFPNWFSWNLGTNTASALTSGSEGWAYSRSSDMTYDGFRTVHRLVWAYDWYKDADALALLNGNLKTFYEAEWASQSKIAAEYAHDGSRLSGGYENTMMTAGAVMALTAGDPTNATAAAIKAAKLDPAQQYGVDADGFGFWKPGPNSGSWAYFSDFWAQFYYLREAGMWVNWGQTTGASGSVVADILDTSTSVDTLTVGNTVSISISDLAQSLDTFAPAGQVLTDLNDISTSLDLFDPDVPSFPTPPPVVIPGPVITRDRWVWIAPDGQSIELTQFVDSIELLKGFAGWGAPPAVVVRDVVPGQAGGRTRSVRHDIQTLSLPLLAKAGNWLDLQAVLTKLIRYMDPLEGDGVMRYIGIDGHVSEMVCKCVNGLGLSGGGDLGLQAHAITVDFEADDPYWYGDPVSVHWSGASPKGWFNILPLSLGSSSLLGDVVIDTGSDVEVWPVWTIVGPGSEPSLTRVARTDVHNKITKVIPEAVVSLKQSALLTAGQTITIDTRQGNQSSTPKSVLGPDGSNWRKFLVRRSLWSLSKGRNEVHLSMPGSTGDSYITLTYRKRTLSP